MLKINPYVLGMMSTNCYVLYEDTEEPDAEGFRSAVVIDAAAEPERLMDICEKDLRVKPVAILLTHGHFDHIMAVDALRERYGIKAYGLKEEAEVFEKPEYNLSGRFESAFTLKDVCLVEDGEVLHFIGHDFQVIATPGHTKGGCCYYVADSNCLFSGDTLFCESYGKFTFPTGGLKDIVKSIVEKLMVLPPETRVFPGHEGATTIEHEQKFNICNVIYRKNKEAGKL